MKRKWKPAPSPTDHGDSVSPYQRALVNWPPYVIKMAERDEGIITTFFPGSRWWCKLIWPLRRQRTLYRIMTEELDQVTRDHDQSNAIGDPKTSVQLEDEARVWERWGDPAMADLLRRTAERYRS